MPEMFNSNQQNEIPMIRGHRIIRMSEKRIGPFALDAETAENLNSYNTGVFIGGCHDADWMLEKMQQLSIESESENFLVLLTSYAMADTYYRKTNSSKSKRPAQWTQGAVTYTTPGHLKKRNEETETNYSAVIVIDPRARLSLPNPGNRSKWNNGGLPRQIARYMNSHLSPATRPPLVFMTCKPAKSLGTQQMLAPFSLDSWWFIEGKSVRIGKPPKQKKKPDSSFLSIC